MARSINSELAKLIKEQAIDAASDRVYKDRREFTVAPRLLDNRLVEGQSLNDKGLHYDKYHGLIPDDI